MRPSLTVNWPKLSKMGAAGQGAIEADRLGARKVVVNSSASPRLKSPGEYAVLSLMRVSTTADGLSHTIFMGEVRPDCSEHAARGWADSNNGNGLASTLIDINYDTCNKNHPDGCHRWCNWNAEVGFKSAHAGGALFSMGDGSVHFLSETIELFTYNRLGSKADGYAFSIP